MNYSFFDISKNIACKNVHVFDKSHAITSVFIDSRQKTDLSNALFFAIKGVRNDGHQFIHELYKKGCRNFVVEEKLTLKNANFIVVQNSLAALQEFATFHRKKFKYPVIAIAGSNGKTIVKEWLHELLWKDYYIVRSPKSYNSQVGVPLSVLQMEPSHQLAFIEAGISKPDEMKKLNKIIAPTVGIFTNIGQAHDEGFLDLTQKIHEKVLLFKNCETVLFCEDHQAIKKELSQLKAKKISWSKTNKKAHLWVSNIKSENNKTHLSGVFNGKNQEIIIPFTDLASIENSIHCWLFLLWMECPENDIKARMLELHPIEMRLQLKEGVNNCLLINDTYNSDIHSLRIALDFLSQMQNNKKKKIVILSEILQSGKTEKELNTEILSLLKQHKIDQFIGVGSKFKSSQFRFKKTDLLFKTTADLLQHLKAANLENAAVLIKGARLFEFEKILKKLEIHTHETRLEIDLKALEHNYNFYKSLLQPKTKMMVMLKAFSYGNGSHEIARMMEYNRVDYIGVAYTDEGIELRRFGIKTPIMIMNPESYQYDVLCEFQLEPVIYSKRILDEIHDYLANHPKQTLNAHIELDTGMHRLGFGINEANLVVKTLKPLKRVKIKTIFSHLASSEMPKDDAFTKKQISEFKKAAKKINEGLKANALLHILNSSGIERFPEAHLDMVRLGIGLYGVSTNPTIQNKLRLIGKLKTSISQINKIKKGTTVGYSTQNKVNKNSVIATIPVGYADGINRKMGNGAVSFYINGMFAKTVGNICMDMCMLDITDIPDAQEGDEVIIFGEQNSPHNLAKGIETISYEIFTSISNRVKRVYFNE